MPKRRYEHREPTHEWLQIRPHLKDMAQIKYELIRPVILWGVSAKERAIETREPRSTIYYQANLFDVAGMASLLPPEPPPPVPKLDKRILPPPMRQAIVDLHAEYPQHHIDEIARILYIQFGRRPSAQTVKLTLANGPKPSRDTRRFGLFSETTDSRERRLTIIRLHAEGWTPTSIAGYLGTSRQTVYTTLKRWIQEQFAGLPDQSRRPNQPATKVTLRAMQEVKKMQVNPELGEYRISAALEQMGIKLSPRTCGRILALNRELYHIQMPIHGHRSKKEMPFKAERRHQFWSVDIRYVDMHRLEGEDKIYCISLLENYSRAILASAITRRQDTDAYLSVFYAAIRKHGCPEALVSDHGGVFLSHEAMHIYNAFGIRKEEIQLRQAWQNYIETCFNVQRRMADWYFETAKTWEDLLATHEKWVRDYNYQKHFAHEQREDGRHSPAEVLGWVSGRQFEPDYMYHAFSAICETRTLTKAGYARFRNFLLYGERGLAGNKVLINIFQDTLALEYGEYPLAKYSVEWKPDDKALQRAGNPRFYDHPYQSPQLELWTSSEVEWFVIIQLNAYEARPQRKRATRILVIQLPLLVTVGDP
jgi:putative transposase